VLAWLLEEASQPELQGFRLRALAQAGRPRAASEFRSCAPEWSAPEPAERGPRS